MNAAVFKRTSLAAMMALALAACGGGGGGDDEPEKPVEPTTNNVTVSARQHATDTRMTCNQGASTEACGLRMYQIMVEAYVNGDDTINYNVGYGPSNHKGDLQGIIDSLDYIKSTGVNAIWLTPVFDSCAGQTADAKLEATGYYACDYFKIDPKFGTSAKFKELVDAAHSKELYVFLDGVFGHASTKLKPLASLPSEYSGLSAPVTAASVPNAHETCKASSTQACFDYSAPETLAYFKAVAEYYVKQYGIDGWRLDQAYQVPISAWEEIDAVVKQAAADRAAEGETWGTLGYMVAEVWDGNQNNFVSKVYGTAAKPGLKSAFDFPLHYGLMQAIGSETSASSNGDATALFANWNDGSAYPDFAMPNLFIGNHDIPRLGDLLQRTGRGDVDKDEYWLRHKATFSFMAATSGPITFYYGEEIGDQLDGFAAQNASCGKGTAWCDDNVARTTGKVAGVTAGFVPSDRQKDLKTYLKSLLDMREKHPALSEGSLTRIHTDANVFISRKDTNSDNVLYLLNVKSTPAKVTLSTAALGDSGDLVNLLDTTNTVTASGGNYVITVPAFTGLFYQINSVD
ncbi:MAG: alpha-amylase family glycosyl hydrolase [Aeromonadaceae bacterium]